MREKRRLAVLIPYDVMTALVSDGVRLRAVNGLPRDVRLVAIETDSSREMLVAVFEHPSLPITGQREVARVSEPEIDWTFDLGTEQLSVKQIADDVVKRIQLSTAARR